MAPNERFLAFMRFQAVDRRPLLEWGPWESTVRRWMKESGLSRDEVLAYRDDCDPSSTTGIDFGMRPPFEERIIEEDSETITKVDKMGITCREFKKDPETSMPEFIGFPVKSPQGWKEIKKRFEPSESRYPADWGGRVAGWKKDRTILRYYNMVATYYGGPSLFGFVRMLLGDEQVLYAFYDEPEMVEDMMETATEFSLAMLRKALDEAPLTYVQFWEDMCFRTGPLISPEMFRKFMVPRYRRITELVRSRGIDVIFVDCDGYVADLIPLWLESGINGLFPMEQAAGNDVHAYAREYGKDLLMMGGIDKRVLAQGKGAIDVELNDKFRLAAGGGYLPTIDHSIPPDVSWDNFQYYWNQKKRMT